MAELTPASDQFYIPLYHRAGGRTQTDDYARLILASGELHGHEGRYDKVEGDVAKISVTVTTIRFRDGSEYHRGEEVQR